MQQRCTVLLEATVGDEIGFNRRCSNRMHEEVQKQDATGKYYKRSRSISTGGAIIGAKGGAAEECNRRMHEANVNATYKYQMLHVNATERCASYNLQDATSILAI
jgi:hypothetical protein